MTYIIGESCIGVKDASCVEVCPVDCIHPRKDEPDFDKENMLYIDEDTCIDCDLCVDECPVQAIFSEDELPGKWSGFVQINRDYFNKPSSP